MQPTRTKTVLENTTAQKKRGKKQDINDDKKRKDWKEIRNKMQIHGEELLGPQASLRVAPCPPAPNHTRGEVIRPPSQITE